MTAEGLSIPEEEVKQVILFYWKAFKKDMASMERSKVLLTGLGSAHIRPGKLDKRINWLKVKIRSEKNHGKLRKKVRSYRKHQDELRKLQAVKRLLVEEGKRKTKIRKKQGKMRAEFYPIYQKTLETNELHQNIKKDLEKQVENPSGD